MSEDLQREPTYRGAAGRASAIRWLDGAFYLPLILSILFGCFLAFASMMLTSGKAPMILVILLAAIWPGGLMAYVLGFRRNKPPGYDRDLFWLTPRYGREREATRVRRIHPLDLP